MGQILSLAVWPCTCNAIDFRIPSPATCCPPLTSTQVHNISSVLLQHVPHGLIFVHGCPLCIDFAGQRCAAMSFTSNVVALLP